MTTHHATPEAPKKGSRVWVSKCTESGGHAYRATVKAVREGIVTVKLAGDCDRDIPVRYIQPI